MRDIARGFGDPATYLPETVRQMKNIGVDSIPITVIVAAFIGGVIALQTRYQLFPPSQIRPTKGRATQPAARIRLTVSRRNQILTTTDRARARVIKAKAYTPRSPVD